MKKQASFSNSLKIVASITLAILMVPFVAMRFTSEVKWSLSDFLVMGTLIFSTGLGYVVLNRLAPNWVYRIAIIVAIATTFFMAWANLAVGLIGDGANMGNIMYSIVVLIVIAGAIIARFRSAGMERVMYTAVLAIVALTSIIMEGSSGQHPGSYSAAILGVGALFVSLFLLAAWLFRAARKY